MGDELENQVHNLANSVSNFVQDGVEWNPDMENIDFWHESAYIFLFSTGFIPVLSLIGIESHTHHRFNTLIDQYIDQLAKTGSLWVENRVKKVFRGTGIVPSYISKEMHKRLSEYFSIGLKAIADRGYNPEKARSYACFRVLENVMLPLVIGLPNDTEYITEFSVSTLNFCDISSKEFFDKMNHQ